MAVYSTEVLKRIASAARKAKKQARVHIKIDTGMSRFGIDAKGAMEYIHNAAKHKEIQIRGIYSHFASSDEDSKFTRIQADRFQKIIAALKKKKVSIPYQHIQNTAGCFLEGMPGNAARAGIGLYGLYPSLWSKKIIQKRDPSFSLQPALSWKTKILQIKEVKKGTSVSYGCTHILKKNSRLALIPLGYWDGFDRGRSNIPRKIV
jgi:alanine racemase